jgi:predicted RNase H-like HicB family nuclease
MSLTHEQEAARLAALPYSVEVAKDETTDGRPIFLARVPELEGCMAQGDTLDQALDSLQEAKLDFILALLVDALPVPLPATLATVTAAGTSSTVILSNKPATGEEADESRPSRLYEAALISP